MIKQQVNKLQVVTRLRGARKKGNYKTWTLDWTLDWTMDWTMDWTQLWTHKEDAETVSHSFLEYSKSVYHTAREVKRSCHGVQIPCTPILGSFPGPAQLSVMQATESWAGPGNEATPIPRTHSGDTCDPSVSHGTTYYY